NARTGTQAVADRFGFDPVLFVGGAGEAVADGGPFGPVGRKFDGDPVKSLAVQFVKCGVKLRREVACGLWHALFEGGTGVVGEPEIGATAFAGKVAAADQQHTRTGAVVFFVLAGGTMGVFEL